MVIFSFNLAWFHTIDPKWTSSNLLKVIESDSADSDDKDAIWAGFMWGARIPSADLYTRLKPFLLQMAHEQPSERKRRHTEILSGLLLSGWGSKDAKKKRFVSDAELRSVLLDATEDFRTHMLWHLEKWSQDTNLRWQKQVIPFLKNAWPKHKKVRTAKASARLCDIALAQGENFPVVSQLVTQLVSKISNEHFFLPEMHKSGNDIAAKYPEELLNLLYSILPERPERWPYGTQDVLKNIEEADSELLNDPKLIERRVANSENLTPWQAGQSGNPSGKPKGSLNRATILKRYLAADLKDAPTDVPFELQGKITVEDAIALALIKKALSGDISAIKEIQDTVYGKLTEPSEISHTYTQMGNVMIGSPNEMAVLTFDVGSEPLAYKS